MTKGNKENQEHRNEKAFAEAFNDLLKPSEHSEEITEIPFEDPIEEVAIESGMEEVISFGPNEPQPELTPEEWAKATENYIPESAGDQEWEDFVSRPPMESLDRESEFRAVSLGLQELRKQKEYTTYLYSHMKKEFQSIYATFPILLQRFFDEVYGKTHEGIQLYIEDMEHLIAGDIDQVKAVKDDYRLHQKFEEYRLAILRAILEFYNKR